MKINDHLNCTYQNDVSKKNLLLDLHCHLRYELIFVLNGSVIINVEGEKRKIGKRLTRVYYHLEPAGKDYLKELLDSFYTVNMAIERILNYNKQEGDSNE